jgi:hypothetical protein
MRDPYRESQKKSEHTEQNLSPLIVAEIAISQVLFKPCNDLSFVLLWDLFSSSFVANSFFFVFQRNAAESERNLEHACSILHD